jgi:two-component system LytT family response regulator
MIIRALIVEDNRIFREELRKSLCEHLPGMIVQEAGNSDEALEKISGALPDLIFVDIRLPGVNGFQLIRRLKAEFPPIRIAILTAYDFPEYRQAAIHYGADRFFVKDTLKWDEVEGFVKSVPADAS